MAEKEYKLEILTPAWDGLPEISRMHMELVGSKSARKVTNELRNGRTEYKRLFHNLADSGETQQ